MKSLLKRHGVFVGATVVLVACFCGLLPDVNEGSQSDAAALINSYVRNVKPVHFSFGSAIGTAAVKLPVEEGDVFEAPFRLKVGDQLLNDAARQMYPSPAMLDIDRDGQLELGVGDIFGSLNVYENLSDDKSEPVWSSHIPLKLSDGNKVKVSNW